jgi:hypothetical protein
MCGRYASHLPPEEIARLFSTVGDLPNIGPNWNVAPTDPAMVVRRHPTSGERRLDLLRWGLVPHFTKDLKAAQRPINARAETAATSGMFRGTLAGRRCIVPADAFYEWKTTKAWGSAPGPSWGQVPGRHFVRFGVNVARGTNKIGVWGLRPQRGPGAEPLALTSPLKPPPACQTSPQRKPPAGSVRPYLG